MSKISDKLGVRCRFNELYDVHQVESGQSTNITEALTTGVVKSSAILNDSNGIEEPGNIVGIVRDNFEAMDAERALRRYGKKAVKPAAPGDGVPQAPQAPQEPSA